MSGKYILCLFLFLGLVTLTSASFDVFVPNHVSPSGDISIFANITNSSGSGIENVNVSVSGAGLTISNVTNGNGIVYVVGVVTSTSGEYTLTISENYTSTTRTIPIVVTPVSTVAFSYLTQPPYTSDSFFRVNITLTNSSSEAVQNYFPSVHVVDTITGVDVNRASTVWNLTNETNETSSLGSIVYNISIPASAGGTYAIIVEGVGFSILNVKSGYYIIPRILDNRTNTQSMMFYPNSGVKLRAVLKDSSDNSVSGASVSGRIVYPNEDYESFTLVETSSPGIYEYNFTNTSSSGSYIYKISATVSGSTVKSETGFTISAYDAKLVPATSEDFFFEIGKNSGFKPAGQVKYFFLFGNKSSQESFSVSASGSVPDTINCSSIKLVDFVASNGTSYNSTVSSSFGTGIGSFFGDDVCFVNFTAPSDSGVYKLTAEINGTGGYVSSVAMVPVNKYILSVVPLESVDGDVQNEFNTMFGPGTNVTFSITGMNMNGTQISASNVDNIHVLELLHLPTGTVLEPTTDFTVISENDSTDMVTIVTPTSYTDAFILKVSADVNGDSVEGEAFFFSKYIVGFVGPTPEGGSQEDTGPDFSQALSCSGEKNFSGSVMLASTSEMASNINLYSYPIGLRNELSGEDYTDCLTLDVDSSVNGSLSTVATFNQSCDFAGGNYFGFANVSYVDPSNSQQYFDQIPIFFSCSVINSDLSLSGMISGSLNSLSANETIQVNLTNAQLISSGEVINGTISVHHMESFSQEAGPPDFKMPDTTLEFNIVDGAAVFNISPSNFSLTKWKKGQGPVSFEFLVCDDTNNCDSKWGGSWVQSSSGLSAWFDQYPSTQFVPGSVIHVRLAVTSNISSGSSGVDNSENITAEFMSQGSWMPISTIVNSSLISDGWNSSSDSGYELWSINLTVPDSLPYGSTGVKLNVVDYNGERLTLFFDGSVQGVTVGVNDGQLSFDDSLSWSDDNVTLVNRGWNMSWISQNFSWSSYSNASLVCIRDNLSISSFGSQGPFIAVQDLNSRVAVVDSNGDGTYDNVLIRNTSISNNMTNRSAFTQINVSSRAFGNFDAYLWNIEDCRFLSIALTSNYTTLNGWVGQYGINSLFTMPVVVGRGENGVSGLTVNLTNVYKESDQGFGVEEELSSSNWSFTSSDTNADGIVFLTGNISQPGRYKLRWSVNGSVNDSASFTSMLHIDMRSFRVFSDVLYNTGNTTVTLFNSSSSTFWDSVPSGPEIYNGTKSNFLNLSYPFRFAFNSTNNLTRINLYNSSSQWENPLSTDTTFNLSSSEISFGALNKQIKVSSFENNGDNVSLAFYLFYPSLQMPLHPSSSDEQLMISICTTDFAVPTPTKLSGVNITGIEFNAWSSGPSGPSSTPLTYYDPITGEDATSSGILTGPSGCVALRVDSPSTGWSGQQGEIRATINQNGNVESRFVAEVFDIN